MSKADELNLEFLSPIMREGLRTTEPPKEDDLVITNHAIYSDTLLYANGRNKPAMSSTQMKEFLGLAEKYGAWPFSKAPAVLEFQEKYVATPGAWIPRSEVA